MSTSVKKEKLQIVDLQLHSFRTGREARTPDTRFWRPMLYQLSYSRVCGCKSRINIWIVQIYLPLFLLAYSCSMPNSLSISR